MRTLREVRWPEVLASALCVVGLGVVGLYFHSFEPKALSPELAEASRRKALVNCGYSMFDVDPQAMQCKAFDRIAIDSTPCWGPECQDYAMTLHANGDAELVGTAPDKAQGTFKGSIGDKDFRRLANLIALHALDRRGSVGATAPDAGDIRIRAGCGGTWHVDANLGGEAGEIDGLGVCLEQVRNDISWDRE